MQAFNLLSIVLDADIENKTLATKKKQHATMREPITPEEKLAITLRFLASGESYQGLVYQYCVSDSLFRSLYQLYATL